MQFTWKFPLGVKGPFRMVIFRTAQFCLEGSRQVEAHPEEWLEFSSQSSLVFVETLSFSGEDWEQEIFKLLKNTSIMWHQGCTVCRTKRPKPGQIDIHTIHFSYISKAIWSLSSFSYCSSSCFSFSFLRSVLIFSWITSVLVSLLKF